MFHPVTRRNMSSGKNGSASSKNNQLLAMAKFYEANALRLKEILKEIYEKRFALETINGKISEMRAGIDEHEEVDALLREHLSILDATSAFIVDSSKTDLNEASRARHSDRLYEISEEWKLIEGELARNFEGLRAWRLEIEGFLQQQSELKQTLKSLAEERDGILDKMVQFMQP